MPRIVTEAGRQIDCNDEQSESACGHISISSEFDSNVNDESDRQLEKHLVPRIVTEAGRQIDCNEEPSRAISSIRISSDLGSKANS
jgi:hypothetical protein